METSFTGAQCFCFAREGSHEINSQQTAARNQIWRVKTNEKLDKLIKHKNIINYIKAQILSWFGHIQRMPDTRTVKKIFNWKPLTKRSQGRPKYRWEDNIKRNICQMKIKNWIACVQDRGKWKEVTEKAKTFNQEFQHLEEEEANNRNLFLDNADLYSIKTRNRYNLYPPLSHLTKYQKAVHYAGIRVFNHLPTSIKSIANKTKVFKKTLMRFLMNNSFYSMDEFFNFNE